MYSKERLKVIHCTSGDIYRVSRLRKHRFCCVNAHGNVSLRHLGNPFKIAHNERHQISRHFDGLLKVISKLEISWITFNKIRTRTLINF